MSYRCKSSSKNAWGQTGYRACTALLNKENVTDYDLNCLFKHLLGYTDTDGMM